MALVELAFVLGLLAVGIEQWIDGIGVSCLEALVYFEMSENVIVGAKIVIHASDVDGFLRRVSRHGAELYGTGLGAQAELNPLNRWCLVVAPRRIGTRYLPGLRRTVGAVVDRKEVLKDSCAGLTCAMLADTAFSNGADGM